MFSNMTRAWDALSPAMQRVLEGLWALHDMSAARETRLRRTPEELAEYDQDARRTLCRTTLPGTPSGRVAPAG